MHGSVSCLTSDIRRVHECAPKVARVTIRGLTGFPALGREQLPLGVVCRTCNILTDTLESMEHHTYFCPMEGMRNEIHKGLAHQIAPILKEAGVPSRNIEMELRGLHTGTEKRPGDVVAHNFFGDGQHLLIDVAFIIWSNKVCSTVQYFPWCSGA